MELHYYRLVNEEKEYLTWEFVKDELHRYHSGRIGPALTGWKKTPVPHFLSSQVELATEWFSISNQEDRHFLRKEREYCLDYIDKELKEIHLAEINNRKLKA